MPTVKPEQLELLLVEDLLWVLVGATSLPHYDFAFERFFACRHPWQRPENVVAAGRFGVTGNYDQLYQQLAREGILLIHTPEQHRLASELTAWYPALEGLTPRSAWFAEPPGVDEIEKAFAWPIFLKGSRQTSKHKAELSIIRSPEQYRIVAEHYRTDPILRWQEVVCREFVPLRPVPYEASDVIPPSFEFRTFWWYGRYAGAGPYGGGSNAYAWTPEEERAALALAGEAAQRLQLPFLVVDVAQTITGDWIVVECNDAQEAGYAGVSPFALWQKILKLELDQGEKRGQ